MMKLRHREVKSLSPLLVVAVSELNSVRAAPDSSPICHAASPVLDFAPPPLGFVPPRMEDGPVWLSDSRGCCVCIYVYVCLAHLLYGVCVCFLIHT